MPESIRSGSQIRDFTPDDTDESFYLSCEFQGSYPLPEILEKAQEKWGPDIKFEQLSISAEYIHCYCIGFDRYDPSDYVEFLLITKTA